VFSFQVGRDLEAAGVGNPFDGRGLKKQSFTLGGFPPAAELASPDCKDIGGLKAASPTQTMQRGFLRFARPVPATPESTPHAGLLS
jgi:hypothetical protein